MILTLCVVAVVPNCDFLYRCEYVRNSGSFVHVSFVKKKYDFLYFLVKSDVVGCISDSFIVIEAILNSF